MKPHLYGMFRDLSIFLEGKYPGAWAYTGSFAMYFHAGIKGKTCRDPDDIDIIARSSRSNPGDTFATTLTSDIANSIIEKYKAKPEQSITSTSSSVCLSECQLVDGLPRVKIDIASADDNVGFLSDSDCVTVGGKDFKFRILTIKALIHSKEKRKMGFTTGTLVEKCDADIKILKQLE